MTLDTRLDVREAEGCDVAGRAGALADDAARASDNGRHCVKDAGRISTVTPIEFMRPVHRHLPRAWGRREGRADRDHDLWVSSLQSRA
jgi:hypothetical protein